MKVIFPSNSQLGLTGSVYNHFGSAPFFVFVDSETGEHKVITNLDKDHEHGNCQPLKAMGDITADVVVVGGIGDGALKKLVNSGIQVFRAVEGSVQTNLELLKENKLDKFTPKLTCMAHQQGGGCSGHRQH
ncbi:MAG: NifB/NifX family molybdenum-iron cluster-binding protein [Desulfamplus sp.]|nr:NifB/NifX family molybdenum-iron cluster-binding protein [Desulfamplus sp.]MBF0389005.1 NifB/NifX family molybdenum-iron cluster-binding protein [Desulfamplus sp.]